MKSKSLRPNFLSKTFPCTVTLTLLAAAMPAAHAANIWDGGAGTGNWNDANNWDDNAVPAVGQNLTFAGDVQTVTSNNIASFTAAGFLLTNDGTVGTSAFTLGGPNGVTSSAAFSISTTAVTVGSITDTISLNLTLNHNASVNTGASHNLIFSGAILNGTGQRAFSKTGVGELTLTNAGNTYGGQTSFNNGILTVDVAGGIANQGVASALGNQSTAANAQLNFNGGTLNVKSGAASTNRQVRIGSTVATATGGATITNNSANGGTPLVFTSAAFNNTTDTGMNAVTVARTLTLGGSNTDANAITGVIADHNTAGGGIVRVTKVDAGTWNLNGLNTYTGETRVNGGRLTIGTAGTINTTSGVSIAGGEFNYNNSTTALSQGVTFSGTGGTLSGTGTITPEVVITSGNRQTAGTSVTAVNSTAILGKETFSAGITYDSGSIFEWNLTGNGETTVGTRGTNYDAVNTASLGGTSAIFRVILNGSQDFSESFWNTDRTWAGIFNNLAESSAYDLSTVFSGGFEYQNSTGTVVDVTGTQGAFSFINSGQDLKWTAVPEPTSALAGILLGAGLLRRRRRA